MKKIVAAIAIIFDVAFACSSPATTHDYFLDVNPQGYQLHDAQDDTPVASWSWDENPKLDNIIDSLNQ